MSLSQVAVRMYGAIPQSIACCIDYDAIARDLRMEYPCALRRDLHPLGGIVLPFRKVCGGSYRVVYVLIRRLRRSWGAKNCP